MSLATMAPTKVEVPRDRWGRYLLPVPGTDKRVGYTRATTLAGAIADKYNLGLWQNRMTAKGIALRPDLNLLAAATPLEDKQTLNDVAKKAQEAAGSSVGASKGTALHSFTEAVDRGEDVNVPPPFDLDIAAYRQAMAARGVQTHPWWIERILFNPELMVAGTCDRVVWVPGFDLPLIADVKSGAFLSGDEIAIQLALYANSPFWFDPATDTFGEVPPLDRRTAMVMHIPAGTGTCQLKRVDLEAGWEGVQLAMSVRAYRTSGKNLITPFPGAPA